MKNFLPNWLLLVPLTNINKIFYILLIENTELITLKMTEDCVGLCTVVIQLASARSKIKGVVQLVCSTILV